MDEKRFDEPTRCADLGCGTYRLRDGTIWFCSKTCGDLEQLCPECGVEDGHDFDCIVAREEAYEKAFGE